MKTTQTCYSAALIPLVSFFFKFQPYCWRACGHLCGVRLIVRSRQLCCLPSQRASLQSQASAPGQRCTPVHLLARYVRLGLGEYGLKGVYKYRSSYTTPQRKVSFPSFLSLSTVFFSFLPSSTVLSWLLTCHFYFYSSTTLFQQCVASSFSWPLVKTLTLHQVISHRPSFFLSFTGMLNLNVLFQLQGKEKIHQNYYTDQFEPNNELRCMEVPIDSNFLLWKVTRQVFIVILVRSD